MKNYLLKYLEFLAYKIYKFLHGLSPPIMSSNFEVKVNVYNPKNFQSSHSTWK